MPEARGISTETTQEAVKRANRHNRFENGTFTGNYAKRVHTSSQTIDGSFYGAPPLWECISCIHFEYRQIPELTYLELGMGGLFMLKSERLG